MKRWAEAAADWGEMGGGMNGFALRMGEEGNGGLEEATEKVGMAVDGGYTSTNAMVRHHSSTLCTPRLIIASTAASVGTNFHRAARGVHPVLLDHQAAPQVPTHEARPVRDDSRVTRRQEDVVGRSRTIGS